MLLVFEEMRIVTFADITALPSNCHILNRMLTNLMKSR
jgi:hypothetical protein